MEKPSVENHKRALKPDAQAFDEIRMRIVPRFKSSELSGSEWRTSVVIDFMRKGKVICSHADNPGDMMNACGLLYERYATMQDNGNGYFASDGIHCDQEGCNEKAEFLYRIKKAYDDNGNRQESYDGYNRCFCRAHSKRGDQSLGDSDDNYELISIL